MKQQTGKVTLLDVPMDLGADNLGVEMGARAFRCQNIIEKLERAGLKIEDVGSVKCRERKGLAVGDPKMRYAEEIVRVNEEVAAVCEKEVKAGNRLVVLGGDHSINLGAMSGVSAALKGNIGMIYLDAHGDMNTDKTTLSGNIHGMNVASLMGFGSPKLSGVHGNFTKLDKRNLLHIGGSDFDQAETDLIRREKLQTFTLFDLLTSNMAPLLRMIDDLASRVPHIWVSLDLDVIDRVYAPGAGMPNLKGLTYREIATIAEYIGRNCPVVGVDVVEYNPLQDVENKTAELGIELIAKFLGKEYSWYTGYMEKNHIG